ncbi:MULTISPECIES: hypothetical protein [Streptococcus]
MPPHSPEYNLIEKTWAHIKKHLKNCPTLVSIRCVSHKKTKGLRE